MKFIFFDLVSLFFISKSPRQKKKKKKEKEEEEKKKEKLQSHHLTSCKTISKQIGGLTSKHLFVIFHLIF